MKGKSSLLLGTAAITIFAAGFCSTASADYSGKGEERGRAKMDRFDLDKNGTISLDEFKAARMRRIETQFHRIDTNGDGQLTFEEIREARQRMREHRQERQGR